MGCCGYCYQFNVLYCVNPLNSCTKKRAVYPKLRKNRSGVPVYHTIGNHDTDRYSLEEVMDFLKIESSYYSFLIDNVKFIVLNTCYIRDGQKCVPFLKRNYNKTKQAYPWLPQMEADWLLQELESEDCFYVVFSHHSLANDFRDRGIANREAVRALLENRKVLFCMNGHYHTITPEDAEIGRTWNGVSIEPKVYYPEL